MNLEPLTPREKEVANLLCRGYKNREVAKELNISVRTVESHRETIYLKYHINSIRELIVCRLKNKNIWDKVIVVPSDLINESTTIMIGEL